eukprot:1976112-Pleurochrysis_carterae.AAC.1
MLRTALTVNRAKSKFLDRLSCAPPRPARAAPTLRELALVNWRSFQRICSFQGSKHHAPSNDHDVRRTTIAASTATATTPTAITATAAALATPRRCGRLDPCAPWPFASAALETRPRRRWRRKRRRRRAAWAGSAPRCARRLRPAQRATRNVLPLSPHSSKLHPSTRPRRPFSLWRFHTMPSLDSVRKPASGGREGKEGQVARVRALARGTRRVACGCMWASGRGSQYLCGRVPVRACVHACGFGLGERETTAPRRSRHDAAKCLRMASACFCGLQRA